MYEIQNKMVTLHIVGRESCVRHQVSVHELSVPVKFLMYLS